MGKYMCDVILLITTLFVVFGQIWCASVRHGHTILNGTSVRPDLLEHTKEFDREIIKVTEKLYVAVGYAMANTIFVLGPEGIIIVDTTETLSSARAIITDFRKLVPDQPIKTIIYTHQHDDHNIGTKEFLKDEATDIDIWSHHLLINKLTEFVSTTGPVAYSRAIRQFGMLLNKDLPYFVNVGIGSKVILDPPSNESPLILPNKFLSSDELEIDLAGLTVRLMHIPGETDDHLGVWIPGMRAFLCGDNVYKTFPNLYAIRGTTSRNPLKWVASLDKIRQLKPEYLLMSHSRPLAGADTVMEVLTCYRDAIQLVHDQTVRMINLGYHREDIARRIALPKRLAEHPYLQQFYGTVKWSSKAIYDGYMGWFSSYAEELSPFTPTENAVRTIEFAGGENVILQNAAEALERRDYQWALELSSMVFRLNRTHEKALSIRTDALKALAGEISSPNGRNYYLTSVLEDHNVLKFNPNPIKRLAYQLDLDKLIKSIAVWVDGEKCANVDIKLVFNVSDISELYLVHLRNGIIDARKISKQPSNFRVMVVVQSKMLREVLSHAKPPEHLYNSKDVQVVGDKVFLKSFFACLDLDV